MGEARPELFRGRHFRDEIIVLCVRWYLRYPLSYRNLEEMMAERGLTVDHSTIARWVLHYAPVLDERIRSAVRNPNRSWRVDETYIRVAGQWTYLYRAIDSAGNTIDFLLSPKRDQVAAKAFLQLALAQAGGVRPRVINVDGHPAYPTAIRRMPEQICSARHYIFYGARLPAPPMTFQVEATRFSASLVPKPFKQWALGDRHDPVARLPQPGPRDC
jgi:transposase-like protein